MNQPNQSEVNLWKKQTNESKWLWLISSNPGVALPYRKSLFVRFQPVI